MPDWSWAVLALALQSEAVTRATPAQYPAFTTEGVTPFPFDDAHLLDPRHRHAGGVWVSANAQPGMQLPLYIYLHGLNRDRIPRRWLHGSHWDMRTIVNEMTRRGVLGPIAVAVPSTTGDSAQHADTIYPRFDVAAFVDAADRALGPQGFRIDRARVIFSAHSASGCAFRNGLFAAVGSPAVQTILDLDCCMAAPFAQALSAAPPSQRVVAVYQDHMWNARDYRGFNSTFLRLAARSVDPSQRVLEHYRMEGIDVHNDIVPVALRRWLPTLVPLAPTAP